MSSHFIQLLPWLMLATLALPSVTFAAEPTDWVAPVALDVLKAAKAPLIPFPREVKWSRADWKPTSKTRIVYPRSQAAELAFAARTLQDGFAALELKVPVYAVDGTLPDNAQVIRLVITKGQTAQAEGYALSVASNGVTISGADAAGAFYGVQTLKQMLRGKQGKVLVQNAEIRDWPAFKVRGFMHDVGRNFQTIESLKSQIDRFAAYKLNVFQFHFCDNPAYHLESRAFPQLNDPQFQTRDKGKLYTFEQVRDLMRYARERHITVIPELDMPGHSAYFNRAFGFSMNSPQGMEVMEKLIAEVCTELPVDLAPYFHLGADESGAKNGPEFMGRMLKAVRSYNRVPLVWNPGLKADPQTIEQRWSDEGSNPHKNTDGNPFVDSGGGYLNAVDPLLMVQRTYFRQLAQQPSGDDKALGGILCCWPDTRVEDKTNIFRHNAVWPGMLAFSEAAWQGRPNDAQAFYTKQPPTGSDAATSFAEFETRMAAHRDRYFADQPFPFVKTSQLAWRVVGPFPRAKDVSGEFAFEPEKSIHDSYLVGDKTFAWQSVRGGTVMLSNPGSEGVFKEREISTAYALTYLYSEKARPIRAWVGFEIAARSNRQAGGIPAQGQWDAFGAQVWVNDAPLAPPVWQEPGTKQYFNPTWFSPANEIPFTDEEFYWTREPSTVQLKAGWNKVLLRVPFGYAGQKWSYSFIPVKQHGEHWIEDESVIAATQPK